MELLNQENQAGRGTRDLKNASNLSPKYSAHMGKTVIMAGPTHF